MGRVASYPQAPEAARICAQKCTATARIARISTEANRTSVLCLTCVNSLKVRIARFFSNFHPYVSYFNKSPGRLLGEAVEMLQGSNNKQLGVLSVLLPLLTIGLSTGRSSLAGRHE